MTGRNLSLSLENACGCCVSFVFVTVYVDGEYSDTEHTYTMWTHLRMYVMQPGTNKAALQRVLERLDNGYDDERDATSISSHVRVAKPSAQTRSSPTKKQTRTTTIATTTTAAAATADNGTSQLKIPPPDVPAPPMRAQSARARQSPAPTLASSQSELGRAPRPSRPASAGSGRWQGVQQQQQEEQQQQQQQQQTTTTANSQPEDPQTLAEEAMLQEIEDRRRQRTVSELRVRLHEQCALNRELDTKLKKKEIEVCYLYTIPSRCSASRPWMIISSCRSSPTDTWGIPQTHTLIRIRLQSLCAATCIRSTTHLSRVCLSLSVCECVLCA